MSWFSRMGWFLLGFAACTAFFLFVPLQFSWDVKVTDLLQLAVTVIIGIIIQKFATEAYSDRRIAKNLLIDRVDQIMLLFNEAHKIFLDCFREGRVSPENNAALLNVSRNINNSLKRLERGLGKCAMKSQSFESVKDSRRDYQRALTGGRYPTRSYTHAAVTEENELYTAITDSLESMRFEINGW